MYIDIIYIYIYLYIPYANIFIFSTAACAEHGTVRTVDLQKMTAGELRLPIFTEEVYEISIQIELDRMVDG